MWCTIMSNNFTKALEFVTKWEGIYSNDKFDPGGKTKYGISDAGDGTIDGLVDLDGDGTGDVKVEELTLEQAIQRYKTAYWDASKCDLLELPMAVAVFDSAVNCGVGKARYWLRQSDTVKDLIVQRRAFYYALVDKKPTMQRYLKGWLNRLNDLDKYTTILSAS